MQQSENARHYFDDIRRSVQLIAGPAWERGDVVELRAPNTTKGTITAYFDRDHSELLVDTAAKLSGCVPAVYITLNPVMADCLARAANVVKLYCRNNTGDKEITHRHWLLIDTDPVRPSGISANDQEHEFALSRANDIRAFLRERGWPDPIFADSGNGGHLLYRIDFPADDGGLVQRVLKALQGQFGDKAVAVDLSVHNPARISKLYGTLACKGSNVPDRPHRLARLLEVPEQIKVVPRESLEMVVGACAPAAPAPTLNPSGSVEQDSSGKNFNVVPYLQARGIEVGKSKNFADGGTLWELKRCPWRSIEPDGGPYVIQFASGKIDAGCHHAQCDGKGWNELRDVIDPGWREREPQKGSGKGPSVAQQIVASTASDEFFHTAEQDAYVTIVRDNRRETWRVRGRQYRLILRGRLYEKGIVVGNTALDDAIATLECKGIHDGPKKTVHVRTAQAGDKFYLDLCNDTWEAVEVSAAGWCVVTEPPVKFVRKEGMLPLPRPVEGGSVEQLRPFINVTDDDWPLVVSWLMAAVRPRGPYPILVVNGEHGSCKTNTGVRIRSLVDPNSVPLRGLPRDDQTLMIWATNSHVVALDNLSSFPTWLSDAMCRVATGGGHSQRALYSDDSEKLFFAVRPQIINGIGDVACRSDFMDRSLVINPPRLNKVDRKAEEDLDRDFAEAQPRILGAILTAAVVGLKRLPEIKTDGLELPRLADFAKWMIAVETGLGWYPGLFMQVMNRNESDSHESAVAGSIVAEATRKFIAEKHQWQGGWSELLDELNEFVDDKTRRRDGWPTDSRTLSNRLREFAPNLRGVGIDIQFHDNKRPKQVSLRPMPVNNGGAGGGFGGRWPYGSGPALNCYGSDFQDEAWKLYERLRKFWLAPPVAAVAYPSLPSDFSDGAEVSVG